MNQIQTLIDSIRDAPHDAVIAAGMSIIPVLIVLWIVNRMHHPERGLLSPASDSLLCRGYLASSSSSGSAPREIRCRLLSSVCFYSWLALGAFAAGYGAPHEPRSLRRLLYPR